MKILRSRNLPGRLAQVFMVATGKWTFIEWTRKFASDDRCVLCRWEALLIFFYLHVAYSIANGVAATSVWRNALSDLLRNATVACTRTGRPIRPRWPADVFHALFQFAVGVGMEQPCLAGCSIVVTLLVLGYRRHKVYWYTLQIENKLFIWMKYNYILYL